MRTQLKSANISIFFLHRTEEEIAEDNLKELEVPNHLSENFLKMDEEILKEES